jgi:hypothetical protein
MLFNQGLNSPYSLYSCGISYQDCDHVDCWRMRKREGRAQIDKKNDYLGLGLGLLKSEDSAKHSPVGERTAYIKLRLLTRGNQLRSEW